MSKLLLVVTVIPAVFCDILTKYWINLTSPNIPIIGDFLKITHIKNQGIAFGTPLPGIHILIPILLLSIAVYLWKSWKKIAEFEKIGLCMILTGGALNALERAIFGSVTDFISVQYFSVFNVADIAITAGVVSIAWGWVKIKKK